MLNRALTPGYHLIALTADSIAQPHCFPAFCHLLVRIATLNDLGIVPPDGAELLYVFPHAVVTAVEVMNDGARRRRFLSRLIGKSRKSLRKR